MADERHDEARPGTETTAGVPKDGDVVECGRCGTRNTLAPDATTCSECGEALTTVPVTKGTDAPAPG
ncbi:MAG TPA: hypothetical protein VM618_11080 [Acidimicrobiia bacterium]|nr:hypothetical protein [Acidimicrobiia bacterium]